MKPPKIMRVDDVCSTKFLSMKEATYEGKSGEERRWSFVSRSTGKGVVTIVPFNKTMRKLLFIRQPRVPVGKIVISFPAGLIDNGETPEQAASRELSEETGYTVVDIISVSPFMPKSAGLTDESAYQVQCIVDDIPGKQHEEVTENIEILWMTPKAFYEYVKTLDPSIYVVEDDTWAFVSGIALARQW